MPLPVASPVPARSPFQGIDKSTKEDRQLERTIRKRRERRRKRFGPIVFFALALMGCIAGFGALGFALFRVIGKPNVPEVTKDESPTPTPNDKRQLASQPGQTLDGMIAKAKRATVFIRVSFINGRFASGSGFFVQGDGLIVTNHHVVGSGSISSIEVVVGSGTNRQHTFTAEIITVSPGPDLALLKIDATDLPEPLQVVGSQSLKEAHDVYVLGFPLGERLGSEITVNKSSVSSLRRSGLYPEIQLNGGIHPGNSGGPIIDANGKVVGVSVAVARSAETIGFAIPGETVKAFLQYRK
jgi:S1-C subfamily serine protease